MHLEVPAPRPYSLWAGHPRTIEPRLLVTAIRVTTPKSHWFPSILLRHHQTGLRYFAPVHLGPLILVLRLLA